MRVDKLLHNMLQLTMHKTRLSCLLTVVETALASKSLSVTALGRHINNQSQTRSNIRKVDRLYSNPHISNDRLLIYKAISRFLIVNQRPNILIDGTKILNTDYYVLRASLAAPGRALTLYEEVFERPEYGSEKLYKRFLENLSKVLPAKCQPILITDAEFRGPWFQLVYERQWDFVGRLRSKRKCCLAEDNDFYEVDSSKVIATSTPRYIGPGEINFQNPVGGNFYAYKKPNKGRHAYTRSGCHSDTKKSKAHVRSAAEPWFLFSSLKKEPKKIVKTYAFRMTIEENFRDTKSERYGLSLNMTRTKKTYRCQVMLIVAALASAIAYLVGCVAEQANWQRQFQANSIRSYRVLSRFFLGCQILHRNIHLCFSDICEAVNIINQEVDVCL